MKVNDLDNDYPQLTRVETTMGTNGYPKSLEYAYYCDSREEMKSIIEDLENEGYEVTELYLRRRSGQQLWNREYRVHSLIELDLVRDSDYVMTLDMDREQEEIERDIFDSLIGDDEDYIEDIGREEADRRVDAFYESVEHLKDKGSITVFYRPDYDNSVDYIITKDCTGYYDGDVTTYQMAFSAEEKSDEE